MDWQRFNVLRSEMSLVGPRLLPVEEVRRFNDLAHRRRLNVRPGITCLWQISGRNQIRDFKDRVRLDLECIDNWLLWQFEDLAAHHSCRARGHRREVKNAEAFSVESRGGFVTLQPFNA